MLLTPPTNEQVAVYRATQQRTRRTRRTVHLTAPATCFGPVVPGSGAEITVDLDDPAVTVLGRTASRGVVTGVVTEVEQALPCGAYTALPGVTAGTPAVDIARDLYVSVVVDEPR